MLDAAAHAAVKASVLERLEEERTAGPIRQRREVAAAMTLCKSHHTRTATPGRRAVSIRVIHDERQKLFNPSLDEEAEAEICVGPPRLASLQHTPGVSPSSRRPRSLDALSMNLGDAEASPSTRAERSGVRPGQLVHTLDRSLLYATTSPQLSTESHPPQPSPGGAPMEAAVAEEDDAAGSDQALEDVDISSTAGGEIDRAMAAAIPPIQIHTSPSDRAGIANTPRADGMSLPHSARRTATSSALPKSPKSPKVPRQRTYDGMKLACDRFLGERMDYDLIQEAIHVTAARAEALEIESRSPMLSAFYGRKLEAAAKVSVYGNKVVSPSTRAWSSSLRQLH